MKKAVFLLITFLLTGALAFMCFSCSSSDDGGDTANAPAGVRQATLNQETVTDAISFLEENVSACSMVVEAQGSAVPLRESLQLIRDIADEIAARRSAQGIRKAAAEGEDDFPMTIAGNCPGEEGSIVIAGTENESTGVFTGSITINNYCQEVADGSETVRATMNGGLQLTMQYNVQADALQSISVSTTAGGVTVNSDDVSVNLTLQGLQISVNQTESETGIGITMSNLTISNMEGGVVIRTVQATDLSIQATATETEVAVSGSMQYIDSEEGSLAIALNDLVVSEESGDVASGTLMVTGANNTKVRITPGGSNTFLIEVDTDGDGTYDYQPGIMDCSSLDTSQISGTSQAN